MEWYFTLKTWSEYYIPLAILGLLVLIVVIVIFHGSWKCFKAYRNAKYLKKCGYEKKLIDTPNHWGYKKDGCKTIRENELPDISLKQLKKCVNKGR